MLYYGVCCFRCFSALVLQCFSAMVSWCFSTLMFQCFGNLDLQYFIALVLQCFTVWELQTLVLECLSVSVLSVFQCFCASLLLCFSVQVFWCYDVSVFSVSLFWCFGASALCFCVFTLGICVSFVLVLWCLNISISVFYIVVYLRSTAEDRGEKYSTWSKRLDDLWVSLDFILMATKVNHLPSVETGGATPSSPFVAKCISCNCLSELSWLLHFLKNNKLDATWITSIPVLERCVFISHLDLCWHILTISRSLC